MVTRRPRFSGIACLRCQFRLLHAPPQHRLARFVAPGVLAQHNGKRIASPGIWSESLAASTRNRIQNASRYINSGRMSLGQNTEAGQTDVALEGSSASDVPLADEPLEDNITEADAEEIWSSLLGEEGEPTEAEVFGYIDELRPTDETILPESDFQKRARTLAEGFTAAQLLAYIRKTRKPTSQPTIYPWEVRRRPWIPDVYGEDAASSSKIKAIGPGSSLLLKGYIQPSMTNKEKVVVQLMRECWGVSIRELMEAPGQLDVTVHELEFALLAAGAQTWLRDISTAFSTVTTTTAMASRSRSRSHSRSQTRHHRHIELLPGRHKLRVFAPAATADAILAEINTMLREASTKRFRLSDVTKPGSTITTETLQAVGVLTGSWVRLDEQADGGNSKDVLVSWVAPASGDASLEGTGDMVFRLLLRAFGPAALPQMKTALDYEPLKKSKARFLSEVDENSREKRSWEHRSDKWARWVEPAPSDSSTARTQKSAKAPCEHALPIEFTNANSSSQGQKWYQSIRTSTVATFGRILHAQPAGATGLLFGPGSTSLSDVASSLPELERILSPTVPPLLGMNLAPKPSVEASSAAANQGPTPAISAPAIVSATILLHFLPDPKSPLSHCAPPLEVHLDAPYTEAADGTGRRSAVFTGLHTITAANVCDVLLPTQPVDVRITQKRFFVLPGADFSTTTEPSASSGIEPLLSFLEQSHLQLDGDGALATPLRLSKLGLPRGVLLPVAVGTQAHEHPQEQHETVTTNYVFAGLEVRRQVETAFEGWTMALTSVEAGRGGGRWTELTLEAVPAAVGSAPADRNGGDFDYSKESFRHAVGRLAEGDRIKWLMPHREIAC